jgi:hypothetical protein
MGAFSTSNIVIARLVRATQLISTQKWVARMKRAMTNVVGPVNNGAAP